MSVYVLYSVVAVLYPATCLRSPRRTLTQRGLGGHSSLREIVSAPCIAIIIFSIVSRAETEPGRPDYVQCQSLAKEGALEFSTVVVPGLFTIPSPTGVLVTKFRSLDTA